MRFHGHCAASYKAPSSGLTTGGPSAPGLPVILRAITCQPTALIRRVTGVILLVMGPASIANVFGQVDLAPERFDREPLRLVSLAPSATEIVLALGEGARLVAVTRHCVLPDEYTQAVRISGFDRVQAESLLALEADLVLASAITTPATVERLRRRGLQVLVLAADGLDGVESDIREVASIMNRRQAAEPILREFATARKQAAAHHQTRHGQAPTVLVSYGLLQTYSAGSGSFMDGLLREAGADNVARASGLMWPTLSMEYILARNPDYLLIVAPAEQPLSSAPEAALNALRQHRLWRQLGAVREGRVYIVDQNLANIPGPRLPQLLNALSALFAAHNPA